MVYFLLPAVMMHGASLVSEHALPCSVMSPMQHSPSTSVSVEQPSPPHWPHAATQHTSPLGDSMPGMSSALGHTGAEADTGADADRMVERRNSGDDRGHG